jgi:hypothetical protein
VSTDLRAREPECCGDPMVHNSWTGEWECAVAYFALADEGAAGDIIETLTPEDVGPDLVETLAHWRGSRVSDETIGAAS